MLVPSTSQAAHIAVIGRKFARKSSRSLRQALTTIDISTITATPVMRDNTQHVKNASGEELELHSLWLDPGSRCHRLDALVNEERFEWAAALWLPTHIRRQLDLVTRVGF